MRVAIVVPAQPADQELLITPEGYAQLRDELELLVGVKRRELAERLQAAREDGATLDDNPELVETLEEQERLERRIAWLETQLALARPVDAEAADGRAAIGTRVLVRDLDGGDELVLDLVGAIEADAARGRFSIVSPVGRAVLGKRAGDLVDVDAPGGRRRLEIVTVEPSPVARH
jgi:transcription elongation factor GreA